jgi:hypothetical protein
MSTSKHWCGDASGGAEGLRDEQAAAENGRDARGRFVPNNPGGPGNPFARRVAELRKVLLNAVSAEDLQIVAEQLVVKAKMGDLAATKLLFQYVLGKPAATVDPDALHVEEVALYQRAPLQGEVTEVVAGRMSAELAADLLRHVVPVTGLRHAETIGAALNQAFAAGADESDEDEEDEEVDFKEEQGGEAAVATGAGMSGGERQSATRPSTNGPFMRENEQTAVSGNGDNAGRSAPVQSRKRRGPGGR